MATWRRKDLVRRSGERSRRMGRILRAEILIPVLALVVAGVALWQAMAAQARADLLAHDLSLANGQLRSLGGYGLATPSPRPAGEDANAVNPPLPALPPVGAPATGSPSATP